MKIYTSWEAAPSRMLALARLLAAAGPLTREDIQTLLQPPAVRGTAPAKQSRATLDASVECKLVEITTQGDEERYVLSSALDASQRDPDTMAATLPGTMVKLLLNPDTSGAPEAFALKCAWFQAQPIPMEHSTRHAVIEAFAKARIGDDLTSEERLEMLMYWMRYLRLGHSLGSRKGDAFVPDPTDLVNDFIPILFAKALEVPIDHFIDSLGKHLPVLDGGSFYQRFAKRKTNTYISDALTLALLRLKEANVLAFSYTPDAKSFRVLKYGERSEQIAKIKRKAKST